MDLEAPFACGIAKISLFCLSHPRSPFCLPISLLRSLFFRNVWFIVHYLATRMAGSRGGAFIVERGALLTMGAVFSSRLSPCLSIFISSLNLLPRAPISLCPQIPDSILRTPCSIPQFPPILTHPFIHLQIRFPSHRLCHSTLPPTLSSTTPMLHKNIHKPYIQAPTTYYLQLSAAPYYS